MTGTGATCGVAVSAGGGVPGMIPSPSSPSRRFRGKNKQPAWKREAAGPVSVIRLPLAVTDPGDRRRLEQLFTAMRQIKRALRRDAAAVVAAYWHGEQRRAADAAAWRAELGLSRQGLEQRAYAHLDRAGHLKAHVTKALVMHQADEVWAGVERHLVPDAAGRRAGAPRGPGSWWGYTRIPGRARSHTSARKWETFRLHGTLAGHLAAYRAAAVPAGLTPDQVPQLLAAGVSVLAQPRAMRVPSGPSQPAGRSPMATESSPLSASSAESSRTASQLRPARRAGAARGAGSWWDHTGPLVLVFSGGPASTTGDLVLPVRLPQGAGRWPYLLHYLGDPARWHKIDLVRLADPGTGGGWRYEAHLLVLGPGYAAPATLARRAAAAALERTGGVDANVSNLSVVSFPTSSAVTSGAPVSSALDGSADVPPSPGHDKTGPGTPDGRSGTGQEDNDGIGPQETGGPGATAAGTGGSSASPVAATRITLSPAQQAALARERKKAAGRRKALDRSRRAANPAQYALSARQQARAARRAQADLPPKAIHLPGGKRILGRSGKRPARPYRHDRLSASYRRLRARDGAAGTRRSQAMRARARQAAAQITSLHGVRLVVEDCHIGAWHRRWGRAASAFTPGQLVTALAAECRAAGVALLRAATAATALSQHCLCGTRVTKRLSVRVHACPGCGLTGDRDLVSAALAALVTFTDPADPATARVDYQRAATLLTHDFQGLQEALSESTVVSPDPAPAPAGRGAGGTAARPRIRRHRRQPRGSASARRTAGSCDMSTPDELRPASAVQGPRRSGMSATPDCPPLQDRS